MKEATHFFRHLKGRNGFLVHLKGHVLHLVAGVVTNSLGLELSELVIPLVDGPIIIFKFSVFRWRCFNTLRRF